MAEILRGVVTNIVDGDTFDLKVLDVVSDDREKYDEIERVRIVSLSDDIEATEANEGGYMEEDEEEMGGTPEEASIEADSADTTRFMNVRDQEDLEVKIKGREVICDIKERTPASVLIANVTVI